jgi:folate-binding protein YgfZ
MGIAALEEQVRALDEGRAFVEGTRLELTLVSGADARIFLGDLVTADIASLGPQQVRPSLLLTPTGRIRAAFDVLGLNERDFLLAQPTDQPETVADALAMYVLSSDVTIGSSRLRIFSVPRASEEPSWVIDPWRPSILGGGFDLVVDGGEEVFRDVRLQLAGEGLVPTDAEAVELRRIRRGEPGFPADLGTGSLPAEGGWERDRIDLTKGCFLGQEAVAKVRNLGHPALTVVALRAEVPVASGEAVLAAGEPVGRVTSTAPRDGGSALIARVRWDARHGALHTTSGEMLRPG